VIGQELNERGETPARLLFPANPPEVPK